MQERLAGHGVPPSGVASNRSFQSVQGFYADISNRSLPALARVGSRALEGVAGFGLAFSLGFVFASFLYLEHPFSRDTIRKDPWRALVHNGPYIALLGAVTSALFLISGELYKVRATWKWSLQVILATFVLGGICIAEFSLSGREFEQVMRRYLWFLACAVAALVVRCLCLLLCCWARSRQEASAGSTAAGDAPQLVQGTPLPESEQARDRWFESGRLHHRLNGEQHTHFRRRARRLLQEMNTRGRLLCDFTNMVRRSYSRRQALTSVWESVDDLLSPRLCLQKHCKRLLQTDAWASWLMCLLFWFHACQILFEIVSVWQPERRNFQIILVACFLLFMLLLRETHRCKKLLFNDVLMIQQWQWEESTKGFAGCGGNVCVVSVSGRDQDFWFGLKGACKELGIGFACLWEADWGDHWWPRWQANVRESSAEGAPLVVLVDAELARSRDERKARTLLGNAQQLEVSFLLENNFRFLVLTNEEFVHYMKEKITSSTVCLPQAECVLQQGPSLGSAFALAH